MGYKNNPYINLLDLGSAQQKFYISHNFNYTRSGRGKYTSSK